jgi:hypothetical protein
MQKAGAAAADDAAEDEDAEDSAAQGANFDYLLDMALKTLTEEKVLHHMATCAVWRDEVMLMSSILQSQNPCRLLSLCFPRKLDSAQKCYGLRLLCNAASVNLDRRWQ